MATAVAVGPSTAAAALYTGELSGVQETNRAERPLDLYAVQNGVLRGRVVEEYTPPVRAHR